MTDFERKQKTLQDADRLKDPYGYTKAYFNVMEEIRYISRQSQIRIEKEQLYARAGQ